MKIRQLSFIAAVALVMIAIGLWFSMPRHPAAPEVQFKTLTGEQIKTSTLRGKVVLVNFWATSCVICMEEMPRMVETYNKFSSRGLEMIAVAMDYDPPNFVLTYAEQKKLPFKVALDIDSAAANGFGNVRLTPTTFVIDRQGRIVQQLLGEPDFAQLHALLDAKLNEAG